MPSKRAGDGDASPRHFRAVIALNLREPPERQQRDQGRQPTEAMDEIDLRAMRPQRRARLPELRRARRETEVGRRPVRDQAPRRSARRVRDQGDQMPARVQPADKRVDHPLDAAIKPWRHGDVRIGGEENSQGLHDPTTRVTTWKSAPRSSGCSQCQRRAAACQAAVFARRRPASSWAQRVKPAASPRMSPGL